MGEKKRRDEIRKKSSFEISEHFLGQWNALVSSCLGYDAGDLWEVPRIAAALSIFLHDGAHFSLISLAGIKSDLRIWDSTGRCVNGRNLLPDYPLVTIMMNDQGFGYSVMLDEFPHGGMEPVTDWWVGIPVARFPDEQLTYSRKDIVQITRNTEGGGHVDPGIRQLTQKLGVGSKELWKSPSGQPVNGTILACSIRQIAHEFLRSVRNQYPRMVENGAHYPDYLGLVTQRWKST